MPIIPEENELGEIIDVSKPTPLTEKESKPPTQKPSPLEIEAQPQTSEDKPLTETAKTQTQVDEVTPKSIEEKEAEPPKQQ